MSEEHHWTFLEEDLQSRKEDRLYRSLTSLKPDLENEIIVYKDQRELINFCSNDYLGLSKHPEVIERSKLYADRYGAGSTASRLISGTFDIHEKLEEKMANFFDREAALLFNSGFQANSTIIGTLLNRNSLILTDKLSHNSLLQGALLSRAALKRFKHNDLEDLEGKLYNGKSRDFNRILIVTESVFSMDGDRSNLRDLVQLSGKYNAKLFVDDAHAVGVWGDRGRGLAYGHDKIDLILNTCGKALGAFGSFILSSQKIRDYLVNYCPGFIYTTSLPPAVIGAIDAAVDIFPKMDRERTRLHEKVNYLREQITKIGFKTGDSTSQIIPIVVGNEEKTIKLSKFLEKAGILATAIRPPTVPDESSRIRVTVTGKHKYEHLDLLLDKLQEWNGT